MSAPTLSELCEPFKADKVRSQVGLAIVADDPPARKLLAAFVLYPLPPWRRPRRRRPTDERELWFWLWEGFENGPLEPTFLDELAVAAGISSQVAYDRWPGLITARAVMPDGTINPEAAELLQSFVRRSSGPRGK